MMYPEQLSRMPHNFSFFIYPNDQYYRIRKVCLLHIADISDRIRCFDIFDTNFTSSNWSIKHSDINHNIDIDFPSICPEAFL
jgi:hypothetical protein